jgi:hypothetical protein
MLKIILLLTILTLAFFAAPVPEGLSIFGFTIPGLCLFKAVFYIDSPTCGMTRSVTSAARMRFAESFNYHPLGIPFLVGVIIYTFFLIFVRLKKSSAKVESFNKEAVVYRLSSKIFTTALLLIWAYKIFKEVLLWH